jgi:hypothetical protein
MKWLWCCSGCYIHSKRVLVVTSAGTVALCAVGTAEQCSYTVVHCYSVMLNISERQPNGDILARFITSGTVHDRFLHLGTQRGPQGKQRSHERCIWW